MIISLIHVIPILSFFFFNDPATTEIYTLSLHDALPISCPAGRRPPPSCAWWSPTCCVHSFGATQDGVSLDRKSTRLNSSHSSISYAVFCLKKKKKKNKNKYITDALN